MTFTSRPPSSFSALVSWENNAQAKTMACSIVTRQWTIICSLVVHGHWCCVDVPMILTGIPALLAWCKRITSDYAGVNIVNFTECWRSGLAFCAIIARFRPDLLDYARLREGQVFTNCSLAFDIAEKDLGIARLLDAEDMVQMEQLEELSIITYLAQFYHKFGDQTPQPATRVSLDSQNKSERDSGLDASSSSSRQSSPVLSSSSNHSAVKSRMSQGVNTIEEMPTSAKVFSYLNNYQSRHILNNHKKKTDNVPTESSADIIILKNDICSDIQTTK